MKTIILEEPNRFEFAETDRPAEVAVGEALVAVRRIGICGTDMHAYRGDQPYFSYPRILGHELGVEVAQVADNQFGIKVGDRCAVEPYLNCASCIACENGKPNCCTSLRVLGVHTDGGMRETIKVPVHKLHRSSTLSLEQLALVETLAIGAHAVDRTQLASAENTLVVGAGPIGLSVVQFAQLAGANVSVMDISEGRLKFCRQQFGVGSTIHPGHEPVAMIQGAFGGELPTSVFDATGSPASMNNAFGYVANGGRLTMVGLVQADISFSDPEFHRRELTVLSSRNSTPDDFKRVVQLLEDGHIDTTPWITHRADFDQMISQFDGWLQPDAGVIKAMVTL